MGAKIVHLFFFLSSLKEKMNQKRKVPTTLRKLKTVLLS